MAGSNKEKHLQYLSQICGLIGLKLGSFWVSFMPLQVDGLWRWSHQETTGLLVGLGFSPSPCGGLRGFPFHMASSQSLQQGSQISYFVWLGVYKNQSSEKVEAEATRCFKDVTGLAWCAFHCILLVSAGYRPTEFQPGRGQGCEAGSFGGYFQR